MSTDRPSVYDCSPMQGDDDDDDDDVSFDDETTLMPGRAPKAPPAAAPKAASTPTPIEDAKTEDVNVEEWEIRTDLLAPEVQARLVRAPALPFQPAGAPAPVEETQVEDWEDRTNLLTPNAQARLMRAPATPFQPAAAPPPGAPVPPPPGVPVPLPFGAPVPLPFGAPVPLPFGAPVPPLLGALDAPPPGASMPAPFQPARSEDGGNAPTETEAPALPQRAPEKPPRHTDSIPVIHDTPFAIVTLPWLFQGRREMRTVIVKATCDLVPGEAAWLREEAELPEGDVHRDDDPQKSLVRATDFVPQKPKVDVTLVGHAHAPGGAAEAALVRLRFGDPKAGGFERRIAVFGERRFERVMGASLGPGKPAPFRAVPLVYELAFGGAGSPDNPVGIGRDGKAAPQLEDPDRLVQSPRDAIPPACFGPIAPRWPVRWNKLGTFDAAWVKERWPSMPADFDWTYGQAAPMPQQVAEARGDEAFGIDGVHPTIAVIEGRLPGVRPRGFADRKGALVEVALRLDTVAIDADAMTIDLVFRGVMEVADDDASDVAALFVTMEPVAGPALTMSEVEARYAARSAELEPVPAPAEHAAPAANEAAPDRFAARENAVKAGLAAAGVASLGAEAAAAATRPPEPEKAAAAAATRAPEPEKAADKALTSEAAALRRNVVALLAEGKSLAGLDLAGADLSELDLSGQTLVRTNLRGARLRDAKLEGADLSEAQLSEAVLSGARAAGVKLSRADLTGAVLDGADLSGAALEEAELSGAHGEGANFRDARGERARFAGGSLGRAVFDGAELPAADFTGAVLDGARFTGAEMREVRLYDASGEGVVFDDANLDGARADMLRLTGASFARITAARSVWDGSTLPGAQFVGARMPGASFARATCERASFAGADLANGNLCKARLAGASFEEANLMQASLESADLTGAVLRGANLYGAETWKAKIDKADLARALVKKTKLGGQA